MATLNKAKAWVIFRADKLQQPDAIAALNNLSKPEFDAYECWAEQFDLELAKIAIEAQNEAAAIMERHTYLGELEGKKPYDWTAKDYINLAAAFEGTKFEKLHLSAMFRVDNGELLLELVKP